MADETPNQLKENNKITQEPVSTAGSELIGESYRIIREIGKGGSASVFEVEHVVLKQRYAMKALHGTYTPVALKRFQQEAMLASALIHPNLVRAYNFGQRTGGEPFYIMDLVSGQSLADRLKQGPLDHTELYDIMIPICEALQYAHDKGTVHRDLKPGNIVLAHEHGETIPKIIDFGIARLTQVEPGDQANLTRTGEVFGTPKYMSPEQCYGEKVDHRSDIYSLGCVIFECLTGAAPFISDTPLATMMLHQQSNPLTLKEASLGKEFPPLLEQCVEKMLAKSPDDRYRNCLEIAQEFRRLKSGTSRGDTIGAGARVPHRRAPVNQKALWIALSGIATVAICGAMYFALSTSRPPSTLLTHPDSDINPFPSAPPADPAHSISNEAFYDKPFSHIEGNERVFSFGPKPIGGLQWTSSSGAEVIRDAVGEVRVPLASRLIFLTKWDNLLNKQTLRGFQKDDLSVLIIHIAAGSEIIYGDEFDRAYDDALFFANHLTGLRRFDADGAPISIAGLRAMQLESFHNLNFLTLSHTKVDLKEFCKLSILPRLSTLNIAGKQDARIVIASLLKLRNRQIKTMDLSACRLNDKDIESIAKLNLEGLELSRNKITDEAIKTLSKTRSLRYLNIRTMPNLTPRSIDYLVTMAHSSLKSLDISPNQWTAPEMERLRKALPKTCHVNLIVEHNTFEDL